MGFFSFHCSKSGQSIPVPHIEETHCTLFLKDGTSVGGVYNGYGRLQQPGTGYPSLDFIMRMVAEKAGLPVPAEGKLYPGDWPQNNLDAVIEAYRNQYPDISPIDLLQGNTVYIFDLVEEAGVKIVKTKFVEEGDTFESLPVSPYARDQGWRYEYDGQWNEPEYEVAAAKKPGMRRP